MWWGFTPSWSKDGKPGPINARAETVATNGMFRSAYKRRRCLLPADGFYEWQATGGKVKQPYWITVGDRELFCFAGIWESREDVESVAIITTEPNELMEPIHNRMPVILSPLSYGEWLGGGDGPDGLLRPYPAELMRAVKVSTWVNSPRHVDARCVEAVEA